MTIEIKHKFQSAKADSSDASLVRPSNWNDTHNINMAGQRLIGRSATGQGVAQEVSLGSGLQFSGTSITVKPDDFMTTAIIEGALGYSVVKQLGDTQINMRVNGDNKLALKLGAATETISWPINITGVAEAANKLGGQNASYYTNIPARLGYTPARQYGSNAMGLYWSGSNPVIRVDGSSDFTVVTNSNALNYVASSTSQFLVNTVGSYCLAKYMGPVSQALPPNQPVSGADLRPCTTSSVPYGTAVLSGTWRCMGSVPGGATATANDKASLFLRYA